MPKGIETTLCLASANRDLKIYPEPNDFALDLKQRHEVQMLVLGSIEMPYSQHLVESDWATFLMDTGISLAPQNLRSLHFLRPITDRLVVLPAPYTPVVFERYTDEGAIWRIDDAVGPLKAHGLVPSSLSVLSPEVFWSPEVPGLKVTSISSRDQVITTLPSDDLLTNFLQGNVRGVLACVDAGARTFRGPQHLVDALNAYFSDVNVQLPLRFEFDADKMVLRLATQKTPEPLVVDSEQPNLLQALQFPCRAPSMELSQLQSVRLLALVERTLPVGNYDFSLLRQQTELVLNPLLQVGHILPGTVHVYFYGIALDNPVLPVIVSEITSYDPKGTALSLTLQFRDALPKLPAIRFDFKNDAFEIRCPTPFRIFWGTTKIGLQLGFGSDLSLNRVHLGSSVKYAALPISVTAPAVYDNDSTGHIKKLVFCTKGHVQASTKVDAVFQDGEFRVQIGQVPLEYLVSFAEPGGGYSWAVASRQQVSAMSEAPDPLPQWYTVLTPLVPFPSDVTPAGLVLKAQVMPVFQGSLNLYFPTTPPASAPRLAEILGFQPGTNLCQLTGCLRAPYQACLDGPAYVLVDFGVEHMSANISHRCQQDVKSQLFGKVVLHCPFKLERMYPLQTIASGTSIITSLRIRIYNPWHSLYQFHGRNWSMTLIAGHSGRTARTECG